MTDTSKETISAEEGRAFVQGLLSEFAEQKRALTAATERAEKAEAAIATTYSACSAVVESLPCETASLRARVDALEDLLREHNDEDYCGCCETNDGNDYRGPCLYCRTRDALSAPPAVSQAAADVLAERRRQIEAEGWTPEHDDAHANHELAIAAACYAAPGAQCGLPVGQRPRNKILPFWPWSRDWWKPTDRRRDLVKAGALILAEIERLDRRGEG